MPSYVLTFLKGLVIGIANIIPGVSGGTMALVLGLYERLIDALHNLGPQTAKAILPAVTLKKEAVARAKQELERIDFWFLCWLGAGALAAIFATAKLITYLLEKQHDPTYGFFCGLILVSILVPLRMMKGKFNLLCLASMLVAIGLAFALSARMVGPQLADKARAKIAIKAQIAAEKAAKKAGTEVAAPAAADAGGVSIEVNHSPLYLLWIFACGAMAISAMILPGVSGSFLLLVLGEYFNVLAAIKRFDILIGGAFAAGCVVGLIAFTRLLNYVMHRWHDATMTFLVGLMLGSFYGLWPFRAFEDIALPDGGVERVYTSLVKPAMDANFAITVVAFLVACAIVAVFIKMEKKPEANA